MAKFNKNYSVPEASVATLCVKIAVPSEHWSKLDELFDLSKPAVERMLQNRKESSSKYYKEIPCVLSKSLIAKYQANTKCKTVKRLMLPVCGDKGKQIKSVEGGIRVPAFFKKAVLPVIFPRELDGFVRGAEFYKRKGKWLCSLSYRPVLPEAVEVKGVIGVDRNSVGNIAVLADLQTGHVRHLGFSPAATKNCWRRRKKNLQRQGKRRLLLKLSKKHARRSTLQNHIVSKAVVDYALSHSRAIALEKLDGVVSKGSKIKSYSTKNQWGFAQLGSFVKYKARLAGVPVVEVDPAYTSQTCSRCGDIYKTSTKKFVCLSCGHKDHRDSNAAFVIAKRGLGLCGLAVDSVSHCSGQVDCPVSGTQDSTKIL